MILMTKKRNPRSPSSQKLGKEREGVLAARQSHRWHLSGLVQGREPQLCAAETTGGQALLLLKWENKGSWGPGREQSSTARGAASRAASGVGVSWSCACALTMGTVVGEPEEEAKEFAFLILTGRKLPAAVMEALLCLSSSALVHFPALLAGKMQVANQEQNLLETLQAPSPLCSEGAQPLLQPEQAAQPCDLKRPWSILPIVAGQGAET